MYDPTRDIASDAHDVSMIDVTPEPVSDVNLSTVKTPYETDYTDSDVQIRDSSIQMSNAANEDRRPASSYLPPAFDQPSGDRLSGYPSSSILNGISKPHTVDTREDLEGNGQFSDPAKHDDSPFRQDPSMLDTTRDARSSASQSMSISAMLSNPVERALSSPSPSDAILSDIKPPRTKTPRKKGTAADEGAHVRKIKARSGVRCKEIKFSLVRMKANKHSRTRRRGRTDAIKLGQSQTTILTIWRTLCMIQMSLTAPMMKRTQTSRQNSRTTGQ